MLSKWEQYAAGRWPIFGKRSEIRYAIELGFHEIPRDSKQRVISSVLGGGKRHEKIVQLRASLPRICAKDSPSTLDELSWVS